MEWTLYEWLTIEFELPSCAKDAYDPDLASDTNKAYSFKDETGDLVGYRTPNYLVVACSLVVPWRSLVSYEQVQYPGAILLILGSSI